MANTPNINIHNDPETKAAIQEARDIMNGDISTKSYASARELFSKLD